MKLKLENSGPVTRISNHSFNLGGFWKWNDDQTTQNTETNAKEVVSIVCLFVCLLSFFFSSFSVHFKCISAVDGPKME